MDERQMRACAGCGQDKRPLDLITIGLEGDRPDDLDLCCDCTAECHADTGVNIDSDTLDAGNFAKVCHWVVQKNTPSDAKVFRITIEFETGSRTEVEFKGQNVHVQFGNCGYVTHTRAEYCRILTRQILGVPRSQTLKPAKFAPPELRVCEALCQDGFAASYEYPGYVQLCYGDNVYAFGTANDFWGGHRVDEKGETHAPYFSTQIPSSAVDQEQLADVVEAIKAFMATEHPKR